jgi:hypothetical protein
MDGLRAEGAAFLHAVLSGMVVYSGYLCVRKFRLIIPHNLLVITIEDILFWLVVSAYLFVQIYYTSDGRIRWYFALGVVFGGVILGVIQRKIEKSAKNNKNLGKY